MAAQLSASSSSSQRFRGRRVASGSDTVTPSSFRGPPWQDGYDTSMAFRLLLVDPQPFFCEALSTALDGIDGVEVLGSATDELEAERMASALSPDVVLTEVELAAGSGLSLARRLGDRARTVILTRRPEGEVLLDAVSAGAMGCLSHETDPPSLAESVRRAAEGRFVLDHDRLHVTLKRASQAHASPAGSPRLAALTSREREILQLLARGLDNRAIAEQLHLSAHTARTHVGNILRKLGVHSRAEAARLALQGDQESDAHVLRIRGPDLPRS
jgi:DNA-binding NarL/FixJ family response regulator